jgi:CubicO group peptidase (beta-lactamase class C family)
MHRVAGPRPEVVRPLRPASDALTKWLAFHAYRAAVGVFAQGRSFADVFTQDLAVGGALGERGGGADPTAPITLDAVAFDVDEDSRTVTVTAPDGTWRAARQHGRYGCVVLPEGAAELRLPMPAAPQRADAAGRAWPGPFGDAADCSAVAGHVDLGAIDAAASKVTADGKARAFVVAYDGRIVAESYPPGFTRDSVHQSWSMTKSLVGALAGCLVHLGRLTLTQPAPVPAWSGSGDPRAAITIDHLLRMSSGLDCPGGITPWADGDKHFRAYSGLDDVYAFASSLPMRADAGSRCSYQNCDPLIAAMLVRNAAAELDVPEVDIPWALLLDPLGMTKTALDADARGNFILSGFSTATALDWARFGQLYLDDGVWQGRRLLPGGWLDYAMTAAPADTEPVYGGAFLWLGNRVLGERLFGTHPAAAELPPFALAAGHYGQRTIIMPSHRLVIVRMGHGLDDDLLVEAVGQIVAAVSR